MSETNQIQLQTCPDTKLRYIHLDGKKYILKEDLQLSFDGAPRSVQNFVNRVGGYDVSPVVHDHSDLESPFRHEPQFDTRPRDGFGGRSTMFNPYMSTQSAPKVETDPEKVSQIQAAEGNMSDEELKELCGGTIPDMNPEPSELRPFPIDAVEDEDDDGEDDEWFGDDDEYDDEEDLESYEADVSDNQSEDLEILD